ncbi:MAG: hypothetical protein DYG83_04355 [Candidatus Brocadia sp. AMX2]|uniref:Endonuclease n=1 Tax=Candidatus Brocadia sinica JPN1 TaxID=1197129 RepID=A0ABQ0K038_9BACT|nr:MULTISPECIES: hypothetical protein [Brocadia]KXK32935.1 MAG: hypothetical protein UZ01_00357 [Candidatus Brocadia sinica]MBC6931715.1 hypothetical protein [Candidatus Brocadia sp.]MBL1169342.1 hypothetical protein [Candidatus Brocadia sp. AMX1]KAA0242261.1 MAG: hypothetical protein EDM70_15075 [Candidatus Brocadia sp. AMX2]MCE7866052.1 hypothetical protein [Candidatus Brocadia sp. AMX2]
MTFPHSSIRRYFSEDVLERIKSGFKFLIDKIIKSGFEYDLQIRNNYFNLYYKGNSLAKVTPKVKEMYEVRINKKFFLGTTAAKDRRFTENQYKRGDYICLKIPNNHLHPLFQNKYLKEFCSCIKKVGFQEETIFEQMIMTDNANRSDFVIIDRQIIDKTDNTRLDLLSLVQINGNDYQFYPIEVKLGNNNDLKEDVIEQLRGYVKRIKDNFGDYKTCYELNIKQKQELGLMNNSLKINIVDGVFGLIVVGAYSKIADKQIRELKQKAPELKVIQLNNSVNLKKAI